MLHQSIRCYPEELFGHGHLYHGHHMIQDRFSELIREMQHIYRRKSRSLSLNITLQQQKSKTK